MQQNDALVSLNGRLVAMGMRARKRRVGVQPLPREIVPRERRVFAMRSPGNREDGRGILAKGHSRAKLLVEPLLPCGRRGRKRILARLFPDLGENPLARHPGRRTAAEIHHCDARAVVHGPAKGVEDVAGHPGALVTVLYLRAHPHSQKKRSARAREGHVHEAARLLALLGGGICGQRRAELSCGKSSEGALGLGGAVQGNVKILCLLSPRPSFQFGGGLVPGAMGHPRCSHVGPLADVLDEERGCASPGIAVLQFGHGHMGKLQPLGGMNRHDAHEIGIEARQRARRLLSQGKVVGELAGHIGDTAALPRELPNDHARFVEVARARHAVGPLKLKPIRQSAVHEKAPQRQRRLFANRAAHEIAQAAARQRQSGAIVFPEGKLIIFLSSEEAARDRLTGASTAIVAFAFAVAFRRPGVRCGEREKSIVGKREQIGGERLVKCLGVVAVHCHAQQRSHKLGLCALAEPRSARHDALEARIAQRLLVDGGAGHRSQQQGHLPGARAGLPQLREALGHLAGAPGRQLLGRHGGATAVVLEDAHGDTCRAVPLEHRIGGRVHRAGGLQMQELVAEDLGLAEDGIHQRQDVAVAAEVVGQLGELRLGREGSQPVAVLEEHVHIGAAEPVDALLRVAHRAHVGEARLRQGGDNGDLQLVGILELVDHDDLEPLAVALGQFRVGGKRVQAPAQQIALIESVVPLRSGVGVLQKTRERHGGNAHPRPQGRLRLGEHARVGTSPGSERIGVRLFGAVLVRRRGKRQKRLEKRPRLEPRIQESFARIGSEPLLGPVDAGL